MTNPKGIPSVFARMSNTNLLLIVGLLVVLVAIPLGAWSGHFFVTKVGTPNSLSKASVETIFHDPSDDLRGLREARKLLSDSDEVRQETLERVLEKADHIDVALFHDVFRIDMDDHSNKTNKLIVKCSAHQDFYKAELPKLMVDECLEVVRIKLQHLKLRNNETRTIWQSSINIFQ